ncbi:MAG: chemotaxis response regulator protein-glutamate methylesterase [Smithellaceae bacterium]|nr:chemotaxis response regulator protein-glutamate methylesterase [Smithellaceae bacterium]
MVKVLIVDDSAFMRNALSSMLSSDHEIQIVGTARDGIEAIEKVATLKPDIVTMDIEMPKMDGLTALRHIMEKTPVPVIMVSSLTSDGAKATLHALELGAVDFIPKNLSELSVNIVKIKEMLIDKIKQIGRKGHTRTMARRKLSIIEPDPSRYVVPIRSAERKIGIVAIGTSTGGPGALQQILPLLPKDFPVPIVIAQHMPPNFTRPFAERLDQLSKISVKEAEEGDSLRPGMALVAPGRGHMRLKRLRGIDTQVSISESQGDHVYRPSVDALASSVSEYYPGRALGLILTGMGNDGLKGFTALKKSGSRIYAQDEMSCVVYGMPRAVVEAGLADKILSLEEIAGELINSV